MMSSEKPQDRSKKSPKEGKTYWRGALADIVVKAEKFDEAEKLILEKIKDGDVPLLSVEQDSALDDPDYIFRDIDEEPKIFEDQTCQDTPCGAAPLGCSDKRYCPRA